ncbi:MAG: SDR family oxidoreductase [Bacteroidota bacterium]
MNVIVTGTSRGIGRELVKAFCRKIRSGTIYAFTRREGVTKPLRRDCEAINPAVNVHGVIHNMNARSYDAYREQLFPKNIRIDIIVNNAGMLVNKPFGRITQEELRAVYDANLFYPFGIIQACLPRMRKGSHIVNISSMGGVQGSAKFPGLSAYSSSKGALAVLSECLAEEFKPKGIAVNCLALGAVQTEMLKEAFPGYKAPLSARQMAEFIADFSLKGHRYFNGKILPVSLSTP